MYRQLSESTEGKRRKFSNETREAGYAHILQGPIISGTNTKAPRLVTVINPLGLAGPQSTLLGAI